MKKKSKKFLLIILILCVIIAACYFFFFKKSEQKEIVKVLDSIDGYDYKLDENDSKLEKKLFYELKDVLESENIDEEKYAKLISQMFISDVFSLDNKISKYDIGGVSFVYSTEQDKFKNIMLDTLYDNVQENYDGDRKQNLPLVDSINVVNCEETNFTFDNNELMSYDIELEWTYSENLGYDTKANVIVSKIDNVYYVMEYVSE